MTQIRGWQPMASGLDLACFDMICGPGASASFNSGMFGSSCFPIPLQEEVLPVDALLKLLLGKVVAMAGS